MLAAYATRHRMLPQRLRDATQPWHARAERSGVMGLLLRRRLSRAGYGRLLRSLLAVYESLEPALQREAQGLARLGVAPRGLQRAPALRADLQRFDDGAPVAVPPLAAAYAARVDALRGEAAHRLLAHLYVRYLGDLHGGQVLGPLVRDLFGLGDGPGAQFYDFGDPGQVQRLRAELRAMLADARLSASQADEVVHEAVWAFSAHVELFEQLQDEGSAQEGPDLLVQRGSAPC